MNKQYLTKMATKKETRGGKREGAGRKPKADEEKVRKLSIKAMQEVFGSEQAFFEHGFKQALESYPYYNLMMQYTYGKPKETKDLKHEFEQQPTFEEVNIIVNQTGADE